MRDNQRRVTLIIVIRVLGLKRRTTREREASVRESDRARVSYAVPRKAQRDRPPFLAWLIRSVPANLCTFLALANFKPQLPSSNYDSLSPLRPPPPPPPLLSSIASSTKTTERHHRREHYLPDFRKSPEFYVRSLFASLRTISCIATVDNRSLISRSPRYRVHDKCKTKRVDS